MVVINPNVLHKVVKTMTPKKERVEEAQFRGTIVFSGGEHFIRIDGASDDSLTPIANIEEGASDSGFVHGDRVLVLIKNHQAIVTKNLTTGLQAKAAKDAASFVTDITDEGITAQRIIANDTFTNTLRANDITADEIIAGMATIDSLDANYAHISNGVIDNAKIDQADVNNLSANYAHVTNGVIDNAKIGHADVNGLSANYAHINNGVIDNAKIGHADVNGLNANYAHITNGVIDNAKIDQAKVDNLSANYAKIDLANVDNAWIEDGLIKDAAITDAKILGVSANKLTAGTIDASNITVTNLNASNITTGSITVDGITIDVENNEASIDGEYIEDGTITLSGLAQEVTDKIDGAIETFTGNAVPTLNNYPASSWTTSAIKDSHIGDVYYVINAGNQADGYCYRFAKNSGTYEWVLIKDSDVTAALQRLTEAEGDIAGLEEFESTTSSWITDTDEELSSIKTNVTNLTTRVGNAEDEIETKVDTSTFNTLSQTVGQNSANITSLTTITTNNGLTASTNITNTVNSVSQTANGNSSKISSLTTTLGTNADGTTKAGDIVHKASAIEQDLNGFKTTVEETYATQTEVDGKADADTVYTKSEINQTVNSINTSISSKANSSDVYTKTQIDQTVSGINASVSAKADGAETTAALSLKANKATLTSEINASADTVKINADKVNITGVITAINNDTTTTIDGGKITTGSITVGSVDTAIQNAVETAQNTFIFDTTYTMSGTTASFEAHLYKGGVDVKEYVDGNDDPLYPPSMFTWYLKHEDSQTQEGDYIGSGYRITVDVGSCNYGAEVIAHFTTTEDSPLLNGNDDNLTDANNNALTGRTESGESVRVRDLTVATSLSGADKLMVIGTEDEHLVSVNTLQAYLNANLDKQVKFNTTAGWNSQTSLVSQANTLYVYTDHQTDSQGRNVAGIKAGDGNAYVVDLPFTDAIATEHIADTTRHITDAERTAWNNKVRCYYAGTENLIFTTA